MSKRIEVGYWAVIYKVAPCCGSVRSMHIPFIVTSIERVPCQCFECRNVRIDMHVGGVDGDKYCYAPISICKRIDPPAEQTDTSADVTVGERV